MGWHYHFRTWHALVQGEKHWWFLPPDEQPTTDAQHVATAATDAMIHFVQRPGDVVYFPDHWHHSTRNVAGGATIAVACEDGSKKTAPIVTTSVRDSL